MNTVFKNPICGDLLLEGKLGKKARSIWMSREGLGVRWADRGFVTGPWQSLGAAVSPRGIAVGLDLSPVPVLYGEGKGVRVCKSCVRCPAQPQASTDREDGREPCVRPSA